MATAAPIPAPQYTFPTRTPPRNAPHGAKLQINSLIARSLFGGAVHPLPRVGRCVFRFGDIEGSALLPGTRSEDGVVDSREEDSCPRVRCPTSPTRCGSRFSTRLGRRRS